MAFMSLLNQKNSKKFKTAPRNFLLTTSFSLISQHPPILSMFLAGNANPFQNLEKTSVLQEARTFNETPVNAKKCIHILTKILYLLNQVI